MKKYFVFTITALMAVSATAFAQKETIPQAQQPVEEPVFRYVEQMPEPPFDVMTYLAKNIKYPPGHDTIGGMRVFVAFVVNADGSIAQPSVMAAHKVPKPYQEESLRLIQGMPKWKPGKQNGKAVSVHFQLPVMFYKDGK